MALNKAKLKLDLVSVLSNPKNINNVDAVATGLAEAFDAYVKTGKATGMDSRGDSHNLELI